MYLLNEETELEKYRRCRESYKLVIVALEEKMWSDLDKGFREKLWAEAEWYAQNPSDPRGPGLYWGDEKID